MIIGGIFGPKLSGKTTLAKAIADEYGRRYKMPGLVLDINAENWPGNVTVFPGDEEKFWAKVWASQNHLVIVDEAAATLRREREFVPAFTRIRHNGHKLIVIGHSGMDLLPVMRQQIDLLFLFRQPVSAAKVWAETFAEPRLLAAMKLEQFEFIRCQLYHAPTRRKLWPKNNV